MDLSVITVTWNAADVIERQIRSVQLGSLNISYEQIIVDNNSADNTLEIVKKFPQIKVIKNNTNTGFGFPNNQAARDSQGEFLLFLNPDMRVAPASLDKILVWMRTHPLVGIASCKLVDEAGELNYEATPRRFPGVWGQVATILKLPHLFQGLLNRYLYKDLDFNQEQEVDSVRGSFLLMRRELYQKLGWAFDPRYFIWFEDVDTCREAKRCGFKVFYTPIISCVDYVGASFKKSTSLWRQKEFTKSMLKYFKKWEPWYVWIWIWLARPIGLALAWMQNFVGL